MADLKGGDFEAFFEAIHGVKPFPWQARLAAGLANGEPWPTLLDLPTGTGKTAALDVAVFHLAMEAGISSRAAPLRILFVVDRRTIVDQAYARALKIARAIETAEAGVLPLVRERLRSIARQDPSLESGALSVAILRGGMPRSDDWAKAPDRPTIVISTVDQVGSRLLFRGYGVSDGMRPVHAGLLGNDVLWLLDEVHLSEPFRETLEAIGSRYRRWAEIPLPAPFVVVEMSATSSRVGAERFGLDAEDRRHEVLRKRLEASKPVSLEAGVKASRFASRCAELAVERLEFGANAVGVVVNRVATAREVAKALRVSAGHQADIELVTGRMRPLDRAEAEQRLVPRVGAGERSRGRKTRPIVVVATQCIEAGADFDFDALITECASLDALKQRFGRLNRLGELAEAPGIIVARAGELGGDPVYGDAIKSTLAWLTEQARLDFGLEKLATPDYDRLPALIAATRNAPVLLPAHLDAWVQTAPTPEPDPDVALWLHGPERDGAEVQLVWRADIEEAWLQAAAIADQSGEAHRSAIATVLAALQPSSVEAMAVPIGAARRWLMGLPEQATADVEGTAGDDEEHEASSATRDWAVARWRGADVEVVRATGLVPGDTLVVPSALGGIAHGNWDPASCEPVCDRAEEAALLQRGRLTVRLHPATLGGAAVPTASEELDDREVIANWLAARLGPGATDREAINAAQVERLRKLEGEGRRAWRVVRVPRWAEGDEPAEVFVVTGRRRYSASLEGPTTEGEEGNFTGVEVTLREHLAGVGAFAGDFARRVGVPAKLARDIELAGGWHDAGKADPRFQMMLHGGDRFRAEVTSEPIAKSAMPANDRAARLVARALSGYPRGARHEVLSVALIERAAALKAQAYDWDLVLHLVASHHGHWTKPLRGRRSAFVTGHGQRVGGRR